MRIGSLLAAALVALTGCATALAQANPAVTHGCDAVHPLPRPCDNAVQASTWSSIYFEVTVPQALGNNAKIDPDTVTATLRWAGHDPVPMLKSGRVWAAGFHGAANGEWTADSRMGWGFISYPESPLPASTAITVTIDAKTFGGLPISSTGSSWSFTTRRDLTGSTLNLPVDLAAPTVHWEGRWFAGEVKVNFDSSRMYDQEAVYQMIDQARQAAPEFYLQQRDFPLFGDYWQATIFDGNPNMMRERETRRITAMRNSGSFTVLTLSDTIEHALYGIADNRPLAPDYAVGQKVVVCDATHAEVSTVRTIKESVHEIWVDKLATAISKWNPNPGAVPPADNPATPDNFSVPVGALRKFDPVGTPVYYWRRLDDELDQHVAHGRKPLLTLHGTPFDACRRPFADNANGGECPDAAKSYLEWDSIVRTFVAHVIDRYGAQTLDWYWSIGNEPDLPNFWVGTDDEFMIYYDYTANAILKAFEEKGLDASRVRVGGGESTGLFPGFEDQLLYHGSPSADFPTPSSFDEHNHACIDPAFTGKLAARISALCTANGNKGTPVDFLSIHSYQQADVAADHLQRAHTQARTIDPVMYANLPVNSHETTPDWVPHRDPASRDGYRWGGFFSTWGGDYFRRMLDPAMIDPRRARGETVLTAWPFNYNFVGYASIAGQLRIDVDGDGTQDRADAVRTPFWLFAELSARMSHDVASLTTTTDAGTVLSGWRSRGPADDKLLLYAHDKFDTGTDERGGWDVTLNLTNLRFPLVEVTEYRVDSSHAARAALAALPDRGEGGLYSPAEVAALETAAQLVPYGTPTTYNVQNGQLTLHTLLLAQGIVALDIHRPDPDGDGVYAPDDNCPFVVNADQLDQDGDRHGDACDCAPLDAGAFALPSEVGAVRFDSDHSTLRWDPAAPTAGPATVHDLYRESASYGAVGGAPDAVCLASGIAGTSFADSAIPAPGSAWRYLTRGRNSCGSGSWGSSSSGAPRSPSACP